MNIDSGWLLSLLPAVYRSRDMDIAKAAGRDKGPLEEFLEILTNQAICMKQDVDRLHDNLFIETCDDWVIPYINDLVNKDAISNNPAQVRRYRAFVANTMGYHRSKGSVDMIKRLAKDITGWSVMVKEFHNLSMSAQNMSVPQSRIRTACISDPVEMARLDMPFTTTPRISDMRSVADFGHVHFNCKNIGVYVWGTQVYRMGNVTPCCLDATNGKYSFDPAGTSLQLFNSPKASGSDSSVSESPCNECSYPIPLTIELLTALKSNDPSSFNRLASPSVVFGVDPQSSTFISPLGQQTDSLLVDPNNGTFLSPEGKAISFVSYAYGFPGELGGGPYDRSDTIQAYLGDNPFVATEISTNSSPVLAGSLPNPNGSGYVLTDNAAYQINPTTPMLIPAAAGNKVLITAGTQAQNSTVSNLFVPNGARPVISGNLAIECEQSPIELCLSGIFFNGNLIIQQEISKLIIDHCTIKGILDLTNMNASAEVVINRSICNTISAAAGPSKLSMTDSILMQAGSLSASNTSLCAECCTFLDQVNCGSIQASNSIFYGVVQVGTEEDSQDSGWIRYSYLNKNGNKLSNVNLYKIISDQAWDIVLDPKEIPAIGNAFFVPNATVLGNYAFTQLRDDADPAILFGADDGAEMGAWHFVGRSIILKNLQQGFVGNAPKGYRCQVIAVT